MSLPLPLPSNPKKTTPIYLFLTRRGIEGGSVIVRHVIRESAVGHPFPVTVVSIINFGIIIVPVGGNVVFVVVLQVLTAGLAAIHRRQTAANAINTNKWVGLKAECVNYIFFKFKQLGEKLIGVIY